MDFDFEAGKEERHRIHFTHDLFWGGLKVSVDGLNVPVESLPGISLHPYFVRAF